MSTLTKEMFEYLAELARMNVKQVRTLQEWTVEGLDHPLTWLGEVPFHPDVRCVLEGHHAPSDPTILLSIHKPDVPNPPGADAVWLRWAEEAGLDFDPAAGVPVPMPSEWAAGDPVETVTDVAEVRRAAARYQNKIDAWLPDFHVATEVLRLYSRLWQARRIVDTDPERFEAIVALGVLDWVPDGKPSRRPVAVLDARIDFDPEAQTVDVVMDPAALRIETDMVPVTNKPSEEAVTRVRTALEALDNLFDPAAVAEALTGLVSDLPASGGRGSWDPAATFTVRASTDPRITFAPLVAVRPRSARARVEALEALSRTDELSTALQTMVAITDAHHSKLPHGEEIENRFHSDILLPEPSSQAQRQMALSMERHPLTVVLGPPGTGKTYTIANLLGHLLAQGKSVLVTAEKEEALHEVRDKVLEAIRPLVVPVLSGQAEDKTKLAQAISEISGARQKRDLADRADAVEGLRVLQTGLLARRSELLNDLTLSWQAEQGVAIETGPYRGTIEEVADHVTADRERYEWLTDRPHSPALPLSPEELDALARIADADLLAAAERTAPLPDPSELPSVEHIEALTSKLRGTERELDHLTDVVDRRSAFTGPAGHDEAVALRDALEEAARAIDALQALPRDWVPEVLEAARRDTLSLWQGRLERTRSAVATLSTAAGVLGKHHVEAPGETPPATLRRAAAVIEERLPEGKRLRRFSFKAEVREAVGDLTAVTVDGSRVDTVDEARVVGAWADMRHTAAVVRADWKGLDPLELPGPMESWADVVRDLADALAEALQFVDKLNAAVAPVLDAGVELDDRWHAEQLRLDARAVTLMSLRRQRDGVVEQLESGLARLNQNYRSHMFFNDLISAMRIAKDETDPEPWRLVLLTMAEERQLRQRAEAARAARDKLSSFLPSFTDLLEVDPRTGCERLAELREAVAWAHAAYVLEAPRSRAELLTKLTSIERELAQTRRLLVAESAWLRVHERLEDDPHLGQALRDYAAAQKRVPKTKTAKSYLPNLRRAQRALRRCADAVPVWIMSVDRAAEMFGAGDRNLFDVVIIDEASQCPITSALVLQYAPAVAIVGDPYQTSPPKFKKHEHLEAARKRISDQVVQDRLDPSSSLWTIGNGVVDRITLTEHFRCPPEVIGWAKNHIYTNLADIRLDVVSAVNPRRPKPVVSCFVPDGFRDGDQNEPEMVRLLSDLEDLLADVPSWVHDVGVIALKPGQARALQRRIFQRFDQRDLERLNLRVGTAYEFQGAQRDLVFLSMVDGPPDDGRTLSLLSQDSDTLNQLNVAVSRAQQQLRVYHSVRPGAFKPEDVRRWLLEHILREDQSWNARTAPGVPAKVSDSVRVDPFDSLSEQRLFNLLAEAGYAVRPQIPAPVGGARYRLDFVVDGEVGAAAVEYDGPHHDTPNQYLADREREQDLIRCGWTVLRLHHTDFNRDRRAALDQLEQQLRHHNIRPVYEWGPPSPTELPDETDVTRSSDDLSDAPADLGEQSSTGVTVGAPAGPPVETSGSTRPESSPSSPAASPVQAPAAESGAATASRQDRPQREEPSTRTASDRADGRSVEAAVTRDGEAASELLTLASQASALLAEGGLPIAALAERLRVSEPTLSQLVDLLESLGFRRDRDVISDK